MKSEFITIQGYDTLPTEDASIKDGFPIKKQKRTNTFIKDLTRSHNIV